MVAMEHDILADRVAFAVEALKRGKTSDAQKAVADAVQNTGGRAENMASVTEELLRYDQPAFAVVVLTDAVKSPKMDWDPVLWSLLAKAQAQAGNKEEVEAAQQAAQTRGEALLSEAGKLSPVQKNAPTQPTQEAIARFLEGSRYYSEMRPDAAKAILLARDAFRLWPESPVLQNALGYTLADMGTTTQDFDEALVLTKRAADALPDSGTVLDSFGWALYRKGDIVGARRVLREAADLEPGIAEIRYHLGTVYAKLGLSADAMTEFDRALAVKPGIHR